MKTKIYNRAGKEVGDVELPEKVFGLKYNDDLVHQVVVSMQANARTPVAHVKDRSEVSGGGIKPWRQKGTGRARHGSNRSPIWIGGGVTHGPTKDKVYKKKINKKMRAKALATVLSAKLRDGEVLLVDKLDFPEPKTKEASAMLASLGKITGFEKLTTKKKNTLYVASFEKNENTEKSFNNFGNVALGSVEGMNLLDVLSHKYLIITNPKESMEVISKRMN